MKRIALLLVLSCLAAGCSKTEPLPEASQPVTDASPVTPGILCYLEGHGTADPDDLSSFSQQLESDGYTWETSGFSDFSTDADILIICGPTEDITETELSAIDSYLDKGGRLFFCMPAYEEPIRFKNIEKLLAEFCIEMDYNLVHETDDSRTYKQDPYWVQTDMLSCPSTMTLYSDDAVNYPAYFRSARSFRITCFENFSDLRLDTMLITAGTSRSTPFGGTEKDPISYEDQCLPLMAYSYDDTRNTCALVVMGSYEFLTDELYSERSSIGSLAWTYSALSWLCL